MKKEDGRSVKLVTFRKLLNHISTATDEN